LPSAGQVGAQLPTLAALTGLGLVASGLALRLRSRLLGARKRKSQSDDDRENGGAEPNLDDHP
jgi:hypothetical protein